MVWKTQNLSKPADISSQSNIMFIAQRQRQRHEFSVVKLAAGCAYCSILFLHAVAAASQCGSGAANEQFALIVDISIRRLILSTNQVTTIYGGEDVEKYAAAAISPDANFSLASVSLKDSSSTVKLIRLQENRNFIPKYSAVDNPYATTFFRNPLGIAFSPDSSFALVADSEGEISSRIRKISLTDFIVVPSIVGPLTGSIGNTDGIGTSAKFESIQDVAISPDGQFALVVDMKAHRLRKINLSTLEVSTLAGASQGFQDGIGVNAQFNIPTGVDISPDSRYALIADSNNHRIRKIDLSNGLVTSIAGSNQGYADGTASAFNFPKSVAISPDGSFALVADSANNKIRKIMLGNNSVSTIAGGTAGYADGMNAQFNSPEGISISSPDTCSLCAEGTYSDDGATACTPCEVGKYASGIGIGNGCNSCIAGTYLTVPGATSSSACITCGKGKFSGQGASVCTECSSGKYSSSSAVESCDDCAAGTFASSTNSAQCENCSVGTFVTGTGSIECDKCADGTYSTVTGATEEEQCLSCGAGTYLETQVSTCLPCSSGKFSSSRFAVNSSVCSGCPTGTYSASNGAPNISLCKPCSPGTFAGSSASTCTSCSAGKFASGITSLGCLSCSAGKFSTRLGAAEETDCLLCNGGEFSATAASACYSCESGTYNTGQGSSFCLSCGAGKHATTQKSTSCFTCPMGKFWSEGSSVCSGCSVGTYASSGDLQVCSLCEAGRYSVTLAAIDNSSCQACRAGTFSTALGANDESECAACSSETYSSAVGATSCSSCSLCFGDIEIRPCNSTNDRLCRGTPTIPVLKYVFAFGQVSIVLLSLLTAKYFNCVLLRETRQMWSIFLGICDILSRFSLLLLIDQQDSSGAFWINLGSCLASICFACGVSLYFQRAPWLFILNSEQLIGGYKRSSALANKLGIFLLGTVPALIVELWLVSSLAVSTPSWLDWIILIQAVLFTVLVTFKTVQSFGKTCGFNKKRWNRKQPPNSSSSSSRNLRYLVNGGSLRIDTADADSAGGVGDTAQANGLQGESPVEISFAEETVLEFLDSPMQESKSVGAALQKRTTLNARSSPKFHFNITSPFEPDSSTISDSEIRRSSR